MKRDPASGLLPRVLRALADGEALDAAVDADIGAIEWLVRGGLGPLLHRVRPAGGFPDAPGADALLRGADLTSRVLTADLVAAIEEIVGALRCAGTEPVLLKGIAFAARYYDEPHLRIMGDVDILVPRHAVDGAIEIVRRLGYAPFDGARASPHHAPPLHHPDRGIHLELHHALLPPTCAAAAEAPLNDAWHGCVRVVEPFASTTAGFLAAECDLMLVAAGWCRDLQSTPRPLADVVALVRSRGDTLDWDRIESWSRGTFTGACAAVVLSCLDRIGAWRGPAGLPARLAAAQPYVNRTSLRSILAALDRYVLRHTRPGRILSPNVLSSVLDALLSARPAWRNLARVPVNIAFPRREPRRFRPGFVLRRLGAPFRPR